MTLLLKQVSFTDLQVPCCNLYFPQPLAFRCLATNVEYSCVRVGFVNHSQPLV